MQISRTDLKNKERRYEQLATSIPTTTQCLAYPALPDARDLRMHDIHRSQALRRNWPTIRPMALATIGWPRSLTCRILIAWISRQWTWISMAYWPSPIPMRCRRPFASRPPSPPRTRLAEALNTPRIFYVFIPMFSVDNDQNPNDAMPCPNGGRPGELCGRTLPEIVMSASETVP
jgi:hypothetical protein